MATDEMKKTLSEKISGMSDAHDSDESNYYAVKELAKKIGFHKDTVYEWIYSKNLPIRRSGFRGRITIYWPDFVKWWSNSSIGEK